MSVLFYIIIVAVAIFIYSGLKNRRSGKPPKRPGNPYGPNYPDPLRSEEDVSNRENNGEGDKPRYDVKKEIRKQANTALIEALIGIAFFGLILGFAALYRGAKAKSLIKRYPELGTPKKYRTMATIAQFIAVWEIVVWLMFIRYSMF